MPGWPSSKLVRFFCLITLFSAALVGCGTDSKSQSQPGRGQANRAQQTVSVAVAPAEQRDVPVYLNGLGAVTAFNTVTVKSRVDGQLVEVNFKEGQEVHKGDLLALIDPRPFQVQLSQAQAQLFKDQAALKDAQINYERYKGLYPQGVVSKQQVDTQKATADQLEGAVKADQAQIDNAKLQLVYTRITAPVTGRIGLRLIDVGNIVHASDANGMIVITQMEPIAVLFTLPEDNLPSVRRQMRSGTLQVDAFSRDNATKLAAGTLLTIDNQIDPTTGTAKLKAVFDNKDRMLWPNQFVNVRMLLETRKDNTVIPTAAVQTGPQGTYVYVVKSDKTADLRPIKVGFSQGNITSVAEGIAPGEVVVTDGQDKLQTGSHVEPRGSTGTVTKLAQAPATSGQ